MKSRNVRAKTKQLSSITSSARSMRPHPLLLEMNAFFFLNRVSQKAGKKIKLSGVPEKEWLDLKSRGIDLIWLMGVWKRSPRSRTAALSDSNLLKAYDYCLPGWDAEDIGGSPYAVYEYKADARVGTDKDLAELKARLNARGMKLILDFVPNHLAVDHPWTVKYPERFVGSHGKAVPEGYFCQHEAKVNLAHGKDPYFPAWTDTVQINVFEPKARTAMIDELLSIAECCDGVRCDMAMLILNDVFEKTWQGALNGTKRPNAEFWAEAVAAVKKKHPEFLFIAESYWDLEGKLQELGFDYTYDKILYDRLLKSDAAGVLNHVKNPGIEISKSVHFIENHDENRSAKVFGDRGQAAACVAATLPGIRFFYDGQWKGKRTHIPVQMNCDPEKTNNQDVEDFYGKLLRYSDLPELHGEWTLLDLNQAWDSNPTYVNMMCWLWRAGKRWALVAVNYSDWTSQARLFLPPELLEGNTIMLKDFLTGQTFERDTKELHECGLYIALDAWQSHLFRKE